MLMLTFFFAMISWWLLQWWLRFPFWSLGFVQNQICIQIHPSLFRNNKSVDFSRLQVVVPCVEGGGQVRIHIRYRIYNNIGTDPLGPLENSKILIFSSKASIPSASKPGLSSATMAQSDIWFQLCARISHTLNHFCSQSNFQIFFIFTLLLRVQSYLVTVIAYRVDTFQCMNHVLHDAALMQFCRSFIGLIPPPKTYNTKPRLQSASTSLPNTGGDSFYRTQVSLGSGQWVPTCQSD